MTCGTTMTGILYLLPPADSLSVVRLCPAPYACRTPRLAPRLPAATHGRLDPTLPLLHCCTATTVSPTPVISACLTLHPHLLSSSPLSLSALGTRSSRRLRAAPSAFAPARPRHRAMRARRPRPCSYRFLATINGD